MAQSTGLGARLAAAWRAFQGDRWVDPRHVREHARTLAVEAVERIHARLDQAGIPRGTFSDDQVANVLTLFEYRGIALHLIAEDDLRGRAPARLARAALAGEHAIRHPGDYRPYYAVRGDAEYRSWFTRRAD